jgi:Zn-dependent peptidase ImmA (M78 family)
MTIKEFPAVKKEKILKEANHLKNNNFILDPFKIAKDHGIPVHFIPLIRPFAFTARDPWGKPEIYITEDATEESKIILGYHELGHVFCEGNYDTSLFNHTIDHESEFTANMFMLQFVPEVMKNKTLNENTDIRALNRYIGLKIRRNTHDPLQGVDPGIFDFIDINDPFWIL